MKFHLRTKTEKEFIMCKGNIKEQTSMKIDGNSVYASELKLKVEHTAAHQMSINFLLYKSFSDN